MNACKHGMRSKQAILPGECPVEFARRKRRLMKSLAPRDGTQDMLAERVVMRNWYRLRGERAEDALAEDAIDELIADAQVRKARRG